MSNDQQGEITEQRVALWRKSFAPDATDIEFQTFVEIVRRTGLSPEARQIYLTGRYDKKKNRNIYNVQTGIDGYRLVADRTGKYAGNDDPVYDDEGKPRKATVTVFKLIGGVRCPFTASARWDQYYPGDAQGFMWKKMPHLMLGKCAEALALRKAFPSELSGLYTNEEMEQASSEPAAAAPPVKAAKSKAQQEAKELTDELKQEDASEKEVSEMLAGFARYKIDRGMLQDYIGQRAKATKPIDVMAFNDQHFGWCRELIESCKTKGVNGATLAKKLYAEAKPVPPPPPPEMSMDGELSDDELPF